MEPPGKHRHRNTEDLDVRFSECEDPPEDEDISPRFSFPGQRAVDKVSARSSQVLPVSSAQGKVHTMKTQNVGSYYLNMHVPKLHGRVVEITPDEEGADIGNAFLYFLLISKILIYQAPAPFESKRTNSSSEFRCRLRGWSINHVNFRLR
jgi:hypothetical protein